MSKPVEKAPDSEETKNSNAEVTAPESQPSDNAGDQSQQKIGDNGVAAEDSTVDFEKKYSESSKEAKRLVEENKKLRKRLGLGDKDPLPTEEEPEKKPEEKPEEKDPKDEEEEEDQDETETDDDSDSDEEEDEDEDESDDKETEVDSGDNPLKGKNVTEQNTLDIIWDRFIDTHDLGKDPKLVQQLGDEFPRFRKDAAGNDVPYKKALEDTYRFVYGATASKKEVARAKDQALIQAHKNNRAKLTPTSTKTSTNSTPVLTPEQRKAAAAMGVSEADYAKNLQHINS